MSKLYIGVNYHPHDWSPERWRIDIDMMKQAGFDTVRLGHLCWDSFEPDDGVYTFDWFDEVMDLFHQAGIRERIFQKHCSNYPHPDILSYR